ncbi:MAG TPA: hypothetical protein VHN20_02665 [Beijerinckiaceae bacterium]|nr:hypothetical protein [Beijerinckiaceae bacterium]
MQQTLWILAGLFDLAFAAFHVAFWRMFDWPRRLSASGAINAAITQTLNIVLIFVFLAYGLALIAASGAQARATAWLPAAGAGLWALRTLLQPLLFPMRHAASIAITFVFMVGAVLHGAAALWSLR